MKSVSIREFQQKANEYLLTLPVLLTRYGTPVARISAVEYEIKDPIPSVDTPLTPTEKFSEKISKYESSSISPKVENKPKKIPELPTEEKREVFSSLKNSLGTTVQKSKRCSYIMHYGSEEVPCTRPGREDLDGNFFCDVHRSKGRYEENEQTNI